MSHRPVAEDEVVVKRTTLRRALPHLVMAAPDVVADLRAALYGTSDPVEQLRAALKDADR